MSGSHLRCTPLDPKSLDPPLNGKVSCDTPTVFSGSDGHTSDGRVRSFSEDGRNSITINFRKIINVDEETTVKQERVSMTSFDVREVVGPRGKTHHCTYGLRDWSVRREHSRGKVCCWGFPVLRPAYPSLHVDRKDLHVTSVRFRTPSVPLRHMSKPPTRHEGGVDTCGGGGLERGHRTREPCDTRT